jgi:hypothetical protein
MAPLQQTWGKYVHERILRQSLSVEEIIEVKGDEQSNGTHRMTNANKIALAEVHTDAFTEPG